MSLIKQLWIGIAVLMLIAFGGSFVLSTLTGKHYLEQQLRLKNMDNATALALSLSQMEKDPVRLELLISAQFDAGHYERIALVTAQGEVLVERAQGPGTVHEAPAWFHRLLPLEVEPASALIQDGWQQFGVLTLNSHTGYAVDNLWDGTVRLLWWFIVVSVAAGVFGTLFLRTVSRPLESVVLQAEAIGDRRFVFSDEPKTQEFRRLVVSMNRLSTRVRTMLEKETVQLEKIRQQIQHDELTGLPNRTFFMAKLDQFLDQEDTEQSGSLIFIRLQGLQSINMRMGHRGADMLLQRIASELIAFIETYEGSFAGRLNGSDFAILIPRRHTGEELEVALRTRLKNLVDSLDLSTEISLPAAICSFTPGTSRGQLLAQTDGALAAAEMKGGQEYVSVDTGRLTHSRTELEEWRNVLEGALNQQGIILGNFTVNHVDGELLHVECPVRILLDGELRQANYFLPWISRLGYLPQLDLLVVEKALAELYLQENSHIWAINLSTETLLEPTAREALLVVLRENSSIVHRLAVEFSQSSVVRHPEAFRIFCTDLKHLGCLVGIKHVGENFSRISQLHDMGLDYIKIDGALCKDVQRDQNQKAFVRGLCTLGHSLGITMIAVNVVSSEEFGVLVDVGIDGMTGPYIESLGQ